MTIAGNVNIFERRPPGTINEYCPICRMVVAAQLTYEYKDNMAITDISICPSCNTVLWEFHFGQPIKFVNRGFVYAKKTEPEKPKGQMRLF